MKLYLGLYYPNIHENKFSYDYYYYYWYTVSYYTHSFSRKHLTFQVIGFCSFCPVCVCGCGLIVFVDVVNLKALWETYINFAKQFRAPTLKYVANLSSRLALWSGVPPSLLGTWFGQLIYTAHDLCNRIASQECSKQWDFRLWLKGTIHHICCHNLLCLFNSNESRQITLT